MIAGNNFGRSLMVACAIYYITSGCVLFGFWFGWRYVQPPVKAFQRSTDKDFMDVVTHWDGRWYRGIVEEGYSWEPGKPSNVAFFPAYPLAGRLMATALGIDPRLALVLVANVTFLLALTAMIYYQRGASGNDDLMSASWPAVVLAAWPISMFYRAAYSEGLFLLIETLVLLGMRRQWRPSTIALLIGVLTACRSVGVAMVLAFAVYLWIQRPATGRWRYGAWAVLWLALACWGIMAYAIFQWIEFGNPLAFVETQAGWRNRQPLDLWETLGSLLTLGPARDIYDSTCKCYWHLDPPHGEPFFNLSFWNPIVLLGTCVTVGWGWWKRIVSLPEFLFAELALAIPYCLQAYTHCFMSGARFAVVILPFFVVLGHVVGRLPSPASALFIGAAMTSLFVFAMQFTADFWIF